MLMEVIGGSTGASTSIFVCNHSGGRGAMVLFLALLDICMREIGYHEDKSPLTPTVHFICCPRYYFVVKFSLRNIGFYAPNSPMAPAVNPSFTIF